MLMLGELQSGHTYANGTNGLSFIFTRLTLYSHTLLKIGTSRRIAHLGVLVGLGAIEIAAIDHGCDAAVDAGRQSSQIPQVCLGWHIACQCVGVPCNAVHV